MITCSQCYRSFCFVCGETIRGNDHFRTAECPPFGRKGSSNAIYDHAADGGDEDNDAGDVLVMEMAAAVDMLGTIIGQAMDNMANQGANEPVLLGETLGDRAVSDEIMRFAADPNIRHERVT